MVFSIIVRWIFYTGPVGSDEVTYVASAARILDGDWGASDYIGATRYGVNLPLAFFMTLLGRNEFGANFWSLITSVGEIALVAHIASSIWGKKEGIIAGLLLATLPLHVHFGGRMMADAPLAFFVTLAFVLFWWAERTGKWWLYLTSGLSIGAVFWIKEGVLAFSLVFALYPLVWRRFDVKWILIVAGAVLVVAANLFLFYLLTGDPFYVAGVIDSAHSRVLTSRPRATEWWYYPYYLFVNIRHTELLGFLALGGLVTALRPRPEQSGRASGDSFVLVWALGLLLLLTFFPMSFSPLKLILKQTNYMLVFMAPMVLLGARFLGTLRMNHLVMGLTVFAGLGLLLSGLEQQAVQNFVANSKATMAFKKDHPGAIVFAGRNARNMAAFYDALDARAPKPADALRPLEDAVKGCGQPPVDCYAIVDRETVGWISHEAEWKDARVPDCWRHVARLQPMGHGVGRTIMVMLRGVAGLLPSAVGGRGAAYITGYVDPKPADAFAVPFGCAAGPRRG